jgi:hypothetical protein
MVSRLSYSEGFYHSRLLILALEAFQLDGNCFPSARAMLALILLQHLLNPTKEILEIRPLLLSALWRCLFIG